MNLDKDWGMQFHDSIQPFTATIAPFCIACDYAAK